MSLPDLLKKIWENSPETIFQGIRRRVKGSHWDYSLGYVLRSSKLMNGSIHLIDRWERYWRVIENKNNDNSKLNFNFQNKNILELGCGPLLGWGPMALFLGAKKCYYYEPNFNHNIVESKEIKKKYFLPLYNEFHSNFNNTINFEDFYDLILSHIRPADFEKNEPIDIVLSNSVLEHIPRNDVCPMMKKIKKLCRSESYFLHAVDFSSHRNGNNCVRSLYSRDSECGNGSLNLLRKSDIENIIKKSGFKIMHSTVYRCANIDKKGIHQSWLKYSDEDLTSMVVFFVGRNRPS